MLMLLDMVMVMGLVRWAAHMVLLLAIVGTARAMGRDRGAFTKIMLVLVTTTRRARTWEGRASRRPRRPPVTERAWRISVAWLATEPLVIHW